MNQLFDQNFVGSRICYKLTRICHFYENFQSDNKQVLKICDTNLDIFLVEQSLDAMIKQKPTGFLCSFGIKYITGRVFSFSVKVKPKQLEYSKLLSIISAEYLFAVL